MVRIELHGQDSYWLEGMDGEFQVHTLSTGPQGDACRLKDLTRDEPLVDLAAGIRVSIVSSERDYSVILVEALRQAGARR